MKMSRQNHCVSEYFKETSYTSRTVSNNFLVGLACRVEVEIS